MAAGCKGRFAFAKPSDALGKRRKERPKPSQWLCWLGEGRRLQDGREAGRVGRLELRKGGFAWQNRILFRKSEEAGASSFVGSENGDTPRQTLGGEGNSILFF